MVYGEPMADWYRILDSSEERLEIKRSKFICTLFPSDRLDLEMTCLRDQHPKARHFVLASRTLDALGRVEEHQSDDGEPRGSAGKPTLAVLRGAGLVNTAAITVRYFGGTRLGVGGLVRAYTAACTGAVQLARLEQWRPTASATFLVPYGHLDQCKYLADHMGGTVTATAYGERTVTLSLTFDEDRLAPFEALLTEKQLAVKVS